MQTSNSNIQTSYFLGTGPLEYYYTLWCRTVVVGYGCFYSYRQNLAHDYEEAVVKATAKTGQQSWQQFDISDYKRTQGPDFTLSPDEVTFTFGKYIGQSLGHVLDINPGYVMFLALKSDWEPKQAKFAKVLGYIRGMFREVAFKAEEEKKAARQVERQARDAARADLPVFEGRVTIEGTVLSTKVVDNQFGSSLKMLVEHKDGWKVWGTVPAAISFVDEEQFQRSLDKGDVVRFDAKVEKSEKDPKFGFFSRATKAVLVRAKTLPEKVTEDALRP